MGYAGGAAGPSTWRAEASILHVDNAGELWEKVLARVRGRGFFETGDLSAGGAADHQETVDQVITVLSKKRVLAN